MARNNHVYEKGDITGDIYYDILKLDGKEVQYLRLYMMVKGVKGAAGVKGLRICVYGPQAELCYGYVHKGSRIAAIGHLQQRITRQGKMVFEVVAEEVEFLRNIDWEGGENTRKDMVLRGLLRPAHHDEDLAGIGGLDIPGLDEFEMTAIPEDLLPDE